MAAQQGRAGRSAAGVAAVTALDSVRRREPLTVALVGGRCWVSDALARTLTEAGDHVVRLDGHDETAAGHGAAGCGADVVVHLARGPQEPSLRGRSEPALRTLAALHAARADGARLVIASLPTNAAHLPADEALAEGFRTAHDVDTVLVEVAECYGPGMPAPRSGVLGRMLHQARTVGVVVVEVDDDSVHPVCSVDDAVAGLVAVVRSGVAGRSRVAPPTAVRTLDLARAVASATGASCRVRDRRRLRVAAAPEAVDRAPARGAAAAPLHRDHAAVLPPPAAPAAHPDLVEGLARCLAGRPDALGATRTSLPAGADRFEVVVDLREPQVTVDDDDVA